MLKRTKKPKQLWEVKPIGYSGPRLYTRERIASLPMLKCFDSTGEKLYFNGYATYRRVEEKA